MNQPAGRQGYSADYQRVPRLAEELTICHGSGSFGNWHAWIGDATIADAILVERNDHSRSPEYAT